jgi:20S proteasome alpha/beta subunit
MTIGISCICERGECIVMASDMRVTYGTSPVGPNDACGKVFRLGSFNTMVCVAGSMSSCHAVISQMVVNVQKFSKGKPVYREHVINAIDEARTRELRRVYDWSIRNYLGISLHEWARGKVPGGKLDKLVLRAGIKRLEDTPFKVELIVAGFVESQTMFFRAAQKEALEEESSPGVYAIGTGQVAAMEVLNGRGQRVAMSLPRTLLHVHEAMVAARLANPRTVGHAQAYIVMRLRVPQTLYLKASAPILESWRKAYRDRRNTGSLDDSAIAARDIHGQLQYLLPNKGEEPDVRIHKKKVRT